MIENRKKLAAVHPWRLGHQKRHFLKQCLFFSSSISPKRQAAIFFTGNQCFESSLAPNFREQHLWPSKVHFCANSSYVKLKVGDFKKSPTFNFNTNTYPKFDKARFCQILTSRIAKGLPGRNRFFHYENVLIKFRVGKSWIPISGKTCLGRLGKKTLSPQRKRD